MSSDKTRFTQRDVKVLARETRFDSFLRIDHLRLQHSLFEGGESEIMDRELLVKLSAVGILLFDPIQQQLVMIRQFRVGMLDAEESPWPLELVAGLVDKKTETLEELAIREIREETGLEASNLVKICNYYNSPGASTEKVHLYCARVDASAAGGVHGLDHEHEDIRVEVLSLEEAILAAQSGIINNAMSLIALQWLQINKESLLEHWS